MSLRLWIWTLFTGSRFKAMLKQGEKLRRSGERMEALELYRQIVRQWPSAPEGYDGLAQVYQAMGLRPEAHREGTIADSLRSLAAKPNDGATRAELCKALMEKEMHGWAAAQAELMLKQSVHKLEFLRLAAKAFMNNGMFVKARDALGEAIRQEPLDPQLYDMLAHSLRASRRVNEATKAAAMADVLRGVSNDPGNVALMEKAVSQLLSGGRRRLALQLVEQGLKSNAQAAGLHRLRGGLLLEERQGKAGLVALKRAVELDPTDIQAHRLLAKAYTAEGQQAQAAYHQAMVKTVQESRQKNDPMGGEMVIIRLLVDGGKTTEALARTQALARQYPQDWRSLYLLGLSLHGAGKAPEAIKALTTAKKLNEKASEPRLELAKLLSDTGEVHQAISEARMAVQLAPRDPNVRRTLAHILRTHNIMDKAVEEEEIAESLAQKSGR